MWKSNFLSFGKVFIAVALVVSIPLSCNELSQLETEELTVQNLLNSDELAAFADAHVKFNEPFVKSYEGMNESEFQPVHDEWESLLRKAEAGADLKVLVTKMGYRGVDSFRRLYRDLETAIRGLHRTFPQLKYPNAEDRDIFKEALKNYIGKSFAINATASCETELEECEGLTLSAYLLRTAGCVLSTTLHPLVAISCQVANSTLHAAEQSECWEAYYECVEERD